MGSSELPTVFQKDSKEKKVAALLVDHLKKIQEISKENENCSAFVAICNAIGGENYISMDVLMRKVAFFICQLEHSFGVYSFSSVKELESVLERSLIIYSHIKVASVKGLIRNDNQSNVANLVTAFAKMYK